MKLSTLTSPLALLMTAVLAADPIAVVDVPEVISNYHLTMPTLAPSVSTILASSLHAIQTSFAANPDYNAALSSIVAAAPESARSSLTKPGYDYHAITTEAWYTVPTPVQKAAVSKFSAIQAAKDNVLEENHVATAAAARVTGMAVAGILGVAGGVIAAM